MCTPGYFDRILAADVVVRPRLLKLLEQKVGLTLVVAPAGYGKTTLLCNWLEHAQLPSAWVSLDAAVNNLYQFLSYLVTAVHEVFPHFGPELVEQLAASSLPPHTVVLEMLCDALDAIDQEFVLVLDDYHAVSSPEIHALLADLVRKLPSSLQLVIAARYDPPLPLTSLRARGQIVEIRSRDLSFTEAETRELLAGSLSAPLAASEISELVRGTEGWVVSLQLARLYLRQEQGFATLGQALDVGAQRAIDFLSEEVLAHLPQAIHEFLLQTAVLERLCARACAAVSDIGITAAAAQASLNWLVTNGIFTVPLDDTQEWFRYHALLRQFIAQQLRRQYPAARIAGLHRRASQWCAAAGYIEEAIHHALAAGDKAEALRVFAQVRPALMNAEDWPQLAPLDPALSPRLRRPTARTAYGTGMGRP